MKRVFSPPLCRFLLAGGQTVNEHGGLSTKTTSGEGANIHHHSHKSMPSPKAIWGIDRIVAPPILSN